MNKVIKCDSCKHSEVCKFRDEYQALTKEIEEMFDKKTFEGSIFDAEITCKHFSKPDMPYWPDGVKRLKEPTNVPKDFDDFKWPNTFNWDAYDCERCPSNPKYSPLGIQVGDSPCTFCPKMQPKVTYTNDTTSTSTSKKFNNTKLTNKNIVEN